MKSIEEATRIKERLEAELLRRPGVTGIDVGMRAAPDGTQEPVIRIYVAEREEAARHAALPTELEGVPVLVVERRFRLH